MDAGLFVGLLGPLQVTLAGREVGPGGSLRRSLLAVLALRAGEVVPVDALVDGLWGDDPPQSATGVLQTYVSTWRKAFAVADLGPRITTVGAGYRLHLEQDESDLAQFARLATDGQRLVDGDPHGARRALEDALALWRGPALADLADRPFHPSGARPIEERRDRIVEDWAELVLRTGTDDDLAAVAARLQELLGARPWRERTTELLMWALFRQSRQHDALELFDQTRRRLGDELGIDPGPALRAMHARVLQQDATLAAARSPARTRTPPRLDSFLGRADDVHHVRDLLSRSRLVTLTGPGGSGKTRLSEEVAADVAADGLDSAVVELAPVEDVALVPAAVSRRLGLDGAESVQALVAALANRQLLVVLDNLEQIPDVGAVITGLLQGVPGLRVLATSREPLRVAGERQYAVDPLPVPAPDEADLERLAATPSVALLLDRSAAAGGSSALTAADAGAVRDVARAVDGLPLALEIVAPWLGPLTPSGLLAELRHPLDLPGRRTGAEARHRTLRAAIAWSYERLSADEQGLLARLSVLRGGGDLDAVRALAGNDLATPALEVLVDLVDRQLVRRAEPVEGAPRFRLLETVRQFAAERLAASGNEESTRLRAARWYASWAVGLARHSEGPGSETWLTRALADADNLRAAMDEFDRSGLAEEHLQLVVDTLGLWFDAGLEGEGERRLQHALAAAPEDAAARPVGLTFLNLFVAVHDPHAGIALLYEAVALARTRGDNEALAIALGMLGELEPDPQVARAANEETFRLAEQLRGRPVRYAMADPNCLACETAGNLAGRARYRDMPTALDWQRRTIEYAENYGDRPLLARNWAEMSYLHYLVGDLPRAIESLDEARRLMTEGATGRWADNLALADALLLQHAGRPAEAEEAARVIIEACLADGRLLHVHFASCFLADLLLWRVELAESDEVLRRAEDLLPDSPDLRHLTRLRARRARWLRLAGRPEEAATLRKETEKGLDPGELSPEHIVWLVESALTAGTPAERERWESRLDALSRRTGVAVPPWERRLLAAAEVIPAARV